MAPPAIECCKTATFGRLLEGQPDALAGYTLTPLAISDPYVLQTSGLAVHNAAHSTGHAADVVSGTVYSITENQLHRADVDEVKEMKRVKIAFASGRRSYVYVKAEVPAGLLSSFRAD